MLTLVEKLLSTLILYDQDGTEHVSLLVEWPSFVLNHQVRVFLIKLVLGVYWPRAWPLKSILRPHSLELDLSWHFREPRQRRFCFFATYLSHTWCWWQIQYFGHFRSLSYAKLPEFFISEVKIEVWVSTDHLTVRNMRNCGGKVAVVDTYGTKSNTAGQGSLF